MKHYHYFIAISFLMFLISEITKYSLDINTLMYNSLAEQLTLEQVDQIFLKARKWQLLGYLLIPILLLLKTHLIAAVLSIGTFVFDKRVAYKKLWEIVLKAEFVFLMPGILKIIWFHFFQTDYTLEDVQYFYPLSLLNAIGPENVDLWFLYPLQTLNVFEVMYWLLLAYLLDKALRTPKNKHRGIKIVASSYGPGLLIWVVAVMFLILNMG